MERKLNTAGKFLFALICLLTLSILANAQKKPLAKKTTNTKKTTAVVLPANNAAEVRNAAEKVSVQIINVSKFVYLLGGIARTIEDLDYEAKSRRISQASIEANNRNKKSVIQGIQNIRAGLIALEIDFRTKPALKNYIFTLQGTSDLAAAAEDLARNGQFTDAGKQLLLAIEKLSNTLVALP